MDGLGFDIADFVDPLRCPAGRCCHDEVAEGIELLEDVDHRFDQSGLARTGTADDDRNIVFKKGVDGFLLLFVIGDGKLVFIFFNAFFHQFIFDIEAAVKGLQKIGNIQFIAVIAIEINPLVLAIKILFFNTAF